MVSKTKPVELPHIAARPCLDDLPYRAIVFVRAHGAQGTPLYQVAGSTAGPFGAEKALKEAHRVHGGVCLYCKKPVAHADLTLDHIEAKANGGSTTIQNLAVACKPCNAAKGHRPIEAFRPKAGAEWLQALMQQVDDRLRRLNPSITAPVPSALNPPLPHPPKRGAAAGP